MTDQDIALGFDTLGVRGAGLVEDGFAGGIGRGRVGVLEMAVVAVHIQGDAG